MSFKQNLYRLYLHGLSLPAIPVLILTDWKRRRIRLNAQLSGIPYSLSFRLRFYLSCLLDLLRFGHGHYGSPIGARDRDAGKLECLRSGPSLFLTAHFHNWEHLGAWMSREGIPLLSAARPMAQPFSQKLLVRFRRRMGMNVAFHDIPRAALRHLESGKCFGFLWDQRPGGVADSVEPIERFFGQPVAMDPLPFFLVRHQSVPVFFGALLPGGKIRLIQIADPKRSSHPYRNLASRYHRVLQILVRAFPDSWYGLAHRRFAGADRYTRPYHGFHVSHVSRETSVLPEVMVSRETKVSSPEL